MIRLLALLLWLPLAANAQNYPEPLSDTVSDYADLLPPEAEDRVAATLQAARDETGVHIVLATINAQADYGYSGRFADFATGWFNFLGIGDAARNDGILILVSKEDREMRIALGRSYDVIWDGRAQRVIDTAMLPAFREDRYAEGLEAGVQSAIEHLARPFAANEEVTETSGFPTAPWWEKLFGPLIFALFGLFMAFTILRKRLRDVFDRISACPNCGKRKMEVTREVLLEPGEETEGQAMRHLRCRACGYDHGERSTLPSKAARRKARASSRSGFGGGSSGGGGASGKW
ncbi:TPM domain-containing protein [Pseudorhodobacter aquimaris]|uniref:TPM domain-containing protein n=1 Tax=Pseudorhodobacter aquimaris TaxID=687412 RepID=UPI00067B8B77|nr:TPM domain-containing protein [Pseudorhodobacter aquimaris]